jgi:hypothetical protein
LHRLGLDQPMTENRENQTGKKPRMKPLQKQVPRVHPSWKEKDNSMYRINISCLNNMTVSELSHAKHHSDNNL